MMKRLILIFLFVTTPIMAQSYSLVSFSQDEVNYYQGIKPEKEKWDIRDTILELSFLTMAGIDLWQTYIFLYRDKDGIETNSILSSKPSEKKLFITAGIWGIGHLIISYILPTHWLRNVWQIITIYGHSYCIIHNFSVGAKIYF